LRITLRSLVEDFPVLSARPLSAFWIAPFGGAASPFVNGAPWAGHDSVTGAVAGSSSSRSLIHTTGIQAPTVGTAVNGRVSAYFDSTASELLDLTTLVLSGYWPTAYAGSPDVGVASAGTSLGNDLSDGGPPTVGTALNGDATMDFSAGLQMLPAHSTANIVGTAAWSFAVMHYARSLTADAAVYTNPTLFQDTANIFGVTISDAGVRAFQYDVAVTQNFTPAVVVAINTWVLIQARWDGTTLSCRVNKGTWQTVSCTSMYSGVAASLLMGYSGYSSLDGLVALPMFAKDLAWSDAVADQIGAAIQNKYALSLGF
jgi:hypothetical protein